MYFSEGHSIPKKLKVKVKNYKTKLRNTLKVSFKSINVGTVPNSIWQGVPIIRMAS